MARMGLKFLRIHAGVNARYVFLLLASGCVELTGHKMAALKFRIFSTGKTAGSNNQHNPISAQHAP